MTGCIRPHSAKLCYDMIQGFGVRGACLTLVPVVLETQTRKLRVTMLGLPNSLCVLEATL